MKHWTDDELLQELHHFYKEYGRIPKTRELKGNWPNASTYRNRFGSLREAVIKAGLPFDDVVVRPYKYKDEELLQFINEAADILGRVPVYTDFWKKKPFHKFPHVKTFENRFGTFPKAVELSGVEERSFEERIEETIKRGERIMEERLQPGPYKNATRGHISISVQGKPTVVKSGVVVNLSEEDLAEIVESDIIRKGLLLPTDEELTIDDAFNRNFYTKEMMERTIKEVENADELAEILAQVDSAVTIDRFSEVLLLLDSPQSYIVVCNARLDELKSQEIPE